MILDDPRAAVGIPQVSIVIPVFNGAAFVAEAIDSALAQQGVSVEVIVVDDGSTDQTPAVLEAYGERISLIRQANAGVAAATNAAVRAARGQWIAFLDADDIFEPTKLRQQLDLVARERVGFCYTDSFCVGDGIVEPLLRSSFEPPYTGDVMEALLVRNFVVKSTVLLRREIYQSLGGMDESFLGVDDWPLWIRCAGITEFAYVPQPLATYRFHKASKSTRTDQTLPDHLRVVEWAFSPDGPGARRQGLRRKAQAESYSINADFALRAGDWRRSLRYALRATWNTPWSIAQWKRMARALITRLTESH
ncbi:MAG: glycosyltransferase [Burkholderiaceae bacterium]